VEILGIDVGGSGIKGCPVDIAAGEITQERLRIPTPKPANPKRITLAIKELVEHFSWQGPIGVGFPAAVRGGIARTAANIDKSWIGSPVERLLQEATGCPVRVVNDADAAGLAEATFGAGKGEKGSVMLLTVGTGIGSALIYRQRLVPNTELGHLYFKGTIAEKYAADSIKKKEDLTWQQWGKRFDEYLNYVYRLFYPDLFVVGGGTSKKFHKFEEYLTVPAPVKPAELQNLAGIVGAALSAKELLAEEKIG
jgi:polyphosphate glucokinase